ncbi:MAG: dihydrodipicolinate synthase family protein, partial [Planctomycetia bacterium]
ILAGAAEANTRETIRACEHYYDLGARAVAIVSPFYYRLSPGAVYAYFAEIAANTPIDVTLYNIPMFASPIDVPTVKRLAEEFPRIAAIKDSSGDVSHMMRMIQVVRPVRPDFYFLTGWDSALLPMLFVGCDGGTNASSGVVPELTRRLYDLTTAGQYDDARRLQYQIINLFDAMLFTADFPEGFRAAAKIRGFDMGVGRQPLSVGQQVDLTGVSQQLHCLLAAEGFAESPRTACPVGKAGVSAADVDLLVQSVVAELKKRGVS